MTHRRLTVDTAQQFEKLARTVILRTYGSSRLNGAFAAVKRSSDMGRIESLSREMTPLYLEDRVCAAKYADFPLWLLRNLHRAARLNLHQTKKLRILDIGSGPGYFIAAARALGHDCRGIDVPDSCFTSLERRVYTGLLEAMKCRQYVSPLSIEPFVPLPFPEQQYNLITAFLICFNRHDQPNRWGVPEWRFFVQDALRAISEGGRLFLGLNEDPNCLGKIRYYDDTLLAYFQSVGAVNEGSIMIQKKSGQGSAASR